MPELPEVETIRRGLAPRIVGRIVDEAASHPSSKFTPASEVIGARFEAVRRAGKYLLLDLDDDRELVIHLGMTGALELTSDAEQHDDPYVRAWWLLDDGNRLRYHDVRRFGRLRVVAAGDYSEIPTLSSMGPDALDASFTPAALHDATRRSSRRIVTQLLSQRPVAGVGNIYANEALWRARIHPAARTISRPQAARLHGAIVEVLGAGVDNGGTTLRDYRTVDGGSGSNQHHLDCYGRAGEPCSRCGHELRSKVYDARTITWCPACQRR